MATIGPRIMIVSCQCSTHRITLMISILTLPIAIVKQLCSAKGILGWKHWETWCRPRPALLHLHSLYMVFPLRHPLHSFLLHWVLQPCPSSAYHYALLHFPLLKAHPAEAITAILCHSGSRHHSHSLSEGCNFPDHTIWKVTAFWDIVKIAAAFKINPLLG